MTSISWRSASDIPIRLMILRKTYEIFQTINLPCDPEIFQSTLEEIVPRLEVALYNTAHSLVEYGNPRTVEQRLENLAPLHGQLKPLEVLWLHGLFAATTVPSTTASLQLDSGYSFTEPFALTHLPPRQQVLPLLESLQVSQVQTQNLVVAPGPSQPSCSVQRQPTSDATQTRDPYTQSIIELHQYLQNYEDASNKAPAVEVQHQEEDRQLAISPNSSTVMGVIDLRCNERLDDMLGS